MKCFCIHYKLPVVKSSIHVVANDESEAIAKFFQFLSEYEQSCVYPLTIYSITILDTI